MKQRELFEGLKSKGNEFPGQGFAGQSLTDEKFGLHLTIDKIVFIVLAFLILLVVVFTLGVEHGKKAEQKSIHKTREVESITNLARVQAAKKSLGIKKKTVERTVSRSDLVRTDNSFSKLFPEAEPKKEKVYKKAKKKEEPKEIQEKVETEETPKAPQKTYEVRLMSIINKDYAEREMNQLLKKGVLASSRKSGNYYIIVLGPFLERSQADKALEETRKVGPFKDAYIRRIVS
jgi:cell division septation protein DedD